MLITAQTLFLIFAASLSSAFAQENAVERTLPTDNGMSIIAWIFMALILAAIVVWNMRSRRRQDR